MVSSILYEGKLKEQQSDYFYSDEYVDFLITKYLFTKRQARVEDVYEYITKYIDPDLVKMSGLKRFLKDNYENIKTMYYLNQSQKENITNTLDMKKDLDFIMFASERKICLKISEQISNDSFNFDKTLLNVLMLDYKYNKNNNKDYYLSLIYYIKNNYQNLISKVKDSIESIDNFYNELELSEVISNNNIIKILSLNNTIIIDDLVKYSPEKLLSIFSIDLSELFNSVSSIGENYESCIGYRRFERNRQSLCASLSKRRLYCRRELFKFRCSRSRNSCADSGRGRRRHGLQSRCFKTRSGEVNGSRSL